MPFISVWRQFGFCFIIRWLSVGLRILLLMIVKHILHCIFEIYSLSFAEWQLGKARWVVNLRIPIVLTACIWHIGWSHIRLSYHVIGSRNGDLLLLGAFIDLTEHLCHVGTCVAHELFFVFVFSNCFYLILHFLEYAGGCGGHWIEVLDVEFVELVTQILLNSLDEVVQIPQIMQCLTLSILLFSLSLTHWFTSLFVAWWSSLRWRW